MVTVTFVKIGFIGTTIIIEALLDERSTRTDLKMRVVSCGVSMDEAEAEEVTSEDIIQQVLNKIEVP